MQICSRLYGTLLTFPLESNAICLGSLLWRQEQPNALELRTINGDRTTITRGATSSQPATDATRLPPGHPEGFHDAFANIYRGAIHRIRWSRHPGAARRQWPRTM